MTLTDTTARRAGWDRAASCRRTSTAIGRRRCCARSGCSSNVLGAPPPPPPPNVPPFPKESAATDGEPRSVRERLAQHRKNPVCANCHAPMDPARVRARELRRRREWRTTDANAPIDASGVLVDGTRIRGAGGTAPRRRPPRRLRPDRVGKLLTYALGRGVDYRDAVALRQIARGAAAHDYRWSAIILEIAKSDLFRMNGAAQGRSRQ